jgi:two-component system, cell cycle sensor histidine kinase PleC
MFARLYESYFDPADPQLRRLRMEQLVLGAQNTAAVGPGFAAIVAAMALFNAIWAPFWLCAIWALSIYAARAFSSAWARHILANPTEDQHLERFALRMVFCTALTVTLVGLGSHLMWAPGEPANHLFWGLACCCGALMVAAQASPFLPHGFTALIYVVLFSTAVAGEGTLEYAGIGVTAMACTVLIWGVLKSLNALSTRTLTLAKEKDALVDKLMLASQAKSDFLASMSHELRTPLNAVIGFSDVMRQETFGPLGAKVYGGYADDIHMSGQHLLSLINDILDLSKIEAGKFELREETVDLHDLARDAARLTGLRAEDGGVDLRIETTAGLVVRGDERALKQCLVNLLTNAIKFTPSGGAVTVRAASGPDGLSLTVADSGCGIHPDDLDKVFETFAQARHTGAAAERGTGLGLPIVRGLMRAHGGDASIASEQGKGTTVTLTLPATRLVPAAKAATAA